MSSYSVGVSSGTDALRFALMAAGVQPGDIVVTVPHTFIATTEAISQAGARPDFVDIDERTYNMDPEKLRQYLETQCVLETGIGRYVHKTTGEARDGHRACSSLRTDGRYGSDPRTRGAIQVECD